MFNVINCKTNTITCDEETGREVTFHEGEAAAVYAKRLSDMYGVKHSVRPAVDDAWLQREQTRLDDGTYKLLPESLGDYREKLVAAYPRHFLHLSDVEGMVAYTKDANMGQQDRQTRVHIEKYLETYFPIEKAKVEFYHAFEDKGLEGNEGQFLDEKYPAIKFINKQEDLKRIAQHIRGAYPYKVLFATTPENIESVYVNYDGSCSCVSNSCMRYSKDTFFKTKIHPASIYGAGDFAIAYITNGRGETTHRALVWPERKLYSRVFGDNDRLHGELKSLGYKKSAYYGEGGDLMVGAKLLKIMHDPHHLIAPYFDEPFGIREDGDFLLTQEERELVTDATNGKISICSNWDYICENCEDHCSETFLVRVERRHNRNWCSDWCSNCRDDEAFFCEATSEYYSRQVYEPVEMHNGVTWESSYFREQGFISDLSGFNYGSYLAMSVVINEDNHTETWAAEETIDHAIPYAGVLYSNERGIEFITVDGVMIPSWLVEVKKER